MDCMRDFAAMSLATKAGTSLKSKGTIVACLVRQATMETEEDFDRLAEAQARDRRGGVNGVV